MIERSTALIARRVKLTLALVAFALLAAYPWLSQSASYAAQTGDSEFFKQKVAPIFAANCVGCHGEKMQRGRLDLRTEASVLKGGSRGATVIAGALDKSVLYRLITHAEEPAMPMGGKLSDADIAVIGEWIKTMKPFAAAASAEHGPAIRQGGYKITDKDRAFW